MQTESDIAGTSKHSVEASVASLKTSLGENRKTVALIGPSGVGKTTVGKALARRLGYTFIDLDRVIEKTLGVDISWIFQLEGEQGFRKHEATVLKAIFDRSHKDKKETLEHNFKQEPAQNTVLSTGGGAVLTEANRKVLTERSVVIYLTASLETLLARTTGHARSRPLLAGNDRRKKIQEMLQAREAIYQELADFTLSIDNLCINQILHVITNCEILS